MNKETNSNSNSSSTSPNPKQRWQQRERRKSAERNLRRGLTYADRTDFQRRREPLSNHHLEMALNYFYDELLVVQSYRFAKTLDSLLDIEGRNPEWTLTVVPLDEALLAAKQAIDMLRGHEDREVVYAATLMHPVGVFMSAHPLMSFERDPKMSLHEDRRKNREWALEVPLNYLSQVDETLGWKMRFLTEQTDPKAKVPQEWYQLREVLLRSMTRIWVFWG